MAKNDLPKLYDKLFVDPNVLRYLIRLLNISYGKTNGFSYWAFRFLYSVSLVLNEKFGDDRGFLPLKSLLFEIEQAKAVVEENNHKIDEDVYGFPVRNYDANDLIKILDITKYFLICFSDDFSTAIINNKKLDVKDKNYKEFKSRIESLDKKFGILRNKNSDPTTSVVIFSNDRVKSLLESWFNETCSSRYPPNYFPAVKYFLNNLVKHLDGRVVLTQVTTEAIDVFFSGISNGTMINWTLLFEDADRDIWKSIIDEYVALTISILDMLSISVWSPLNDSVVNQPSTDRMAFYFEDCLSFLEDSLPIKYIEPSLDDTPENRFDYDFSDPSQYWDDDDLEYVLKTIYFDSGYGLEDFNELSKENYVKVMKLLKEKFPKDEPQECLDKFFENIYEKKESLCDCCELFDQVLYNNLHRTNSSVASILDVCINKRKQSLDSLLSHLDTTNSKGNDFLDFIDAAFLIDNIIDDESGTLRKDILKAINNSIKPSLGKMYQKLFLPNDDLVFIKSNGYSSFLDDDGQLNLTLLNDLPTFKASEYLNADSSLKSKNLSALLESYDLEFDPDALGETAYIKNFEQFFLYLSYLYLLNKVITTNNPTLESDFKCVFKMDTKYQEDTKNKIEQRIDNQAKLHSTLPKS